MTVIYFSALKEIFLIQLLIGVRVDLKVANLIGLLLHILHHPSLSLPIFSYRFSVHCFFLSAIISFIFQLTSPELDELRDSFQTFELHSPRRFFITQKPRANSADSALAFTFPGVDDHQLDGHTKSGGPSSA